MAEILELTFLWSKKVRNLILSMVWKYIVKWSVVKNFLVIYFICQLTFELLNKRKNIYKAIGDMPSLGAYAHDESNLGGGDMPLLDKLLIEFEIVCFCPC